jgi:LPXTG-motif cell wall-anchored protein
LVLAAAVVCATAIASHAQQTTSSSETKAFEVLAVDGNLLDVRLPEGTRELTVPDDFRFTVNGQQLSVHELRAGMKGTATITTRTTVTPVTVTEVKNGTVAVRSSAGIIVRTSEGVKSFSQSDVDKRGVKIMRDGKPVQVSELREGDRLSATIITAQPPKIVTEKEVNATLATVKAGGAAAPPAAPAPRPAAAVAAAPVPAKEPAPAPAPAAARTLPKTASSWPLLALASVLSLAIGLVLAIRRRFVH